MRKLSAYKRSLGFLTAAFAFAAAVTGCSDSSSDSADTTSAAIITTEESALKAQTASNFSTDFDDIFSDRDLEQSYGSVSADIELKGSSVDIDGEGASADGSTVTITAKGVYRFTGTLDDAQIIVDAKGEKVQIVLSGTSISCKTSAPIYVKDADKVFITLAEGTENKLTDSSPAVSDEDTDTPDAAIFSADSLTFNGSGSLSVISDNNSGIRCKDDVVVTGGDITVKAASHGIKAKDYFAAAGGSVTVDAGGDGVKTTNTEDTSLGFIYIRNGSFTINSEGDGFSASTVFYAEDGEYSVVSGGGSSNSTKTHTEGFPGGFGGGNFGGRGSFEGFGGSMPELPTNEDGSFSMPEGFDPGNFGGGKGGFEGFGGSIPELPTNEDGSFSMPEGFDSGNFGGRGSFEGFGGSMPELPTNEDGSFSMPEGFEPGNSGGRGSFDRGSFSRESGNSESSDDSVSTKSIKAGSEITVTGGKFTLDSADDALHSNGNITVSGGSFSISAGDDGIHADETVEITASGKIDITNSYEGIEGKVINISGGTTEVNASDDGVNAGDGSSQSGMGSYSSDVSINISGGILYVNSEGDGIDSNGDLNISGGTTVVDGSSNGGNGALDSNGKITVTGGTVVAAGASTMAEYPGESSTQNSVSATFDKTYPAGTNIALTGSDGSEIICFTSARSFNNIVISSPDIREGETYTFYTGGKFADTSAELHLSSGNSGGTEAGSFTAEKGTSFIGTQSSFGGGFGGGRSGRNGGQRPDDSGFNPEERKSSKTI